ncbi:MAG: thermopsin family protease [Thermoplasmata archaeon]
MAPTTSLPNLAAIENPAHAVNGLVYPGYVAQPAPLGVADYGLGVTPYSYNSSYVAGIVTLNAPPNVTQPGAFGVVNPTMTGEHLGYVGSFWEFGIQLNTIGVNLTIPGTDDQGYVWAQNVVNWNDTSLHFVQDSWNFSLNSDAGWNLNSIYSGCGTNTAGVNYLLEEYGGVLQCSEGNVPITAADYPITLSLYNNFTTNSNNRSQLVYGYNIYEAGSGHDLSGIADTVVFNNTAPSWQNPSAPANNPANTVNPFEPTPTYGPGFGFWQDSEIDIVGGIGGDNAMFRSINGTVNLEYTNTSTGTWKNVPSAYNFGSDTGETAAGIADYWTTGHQLVINQGPTLLYGLWNAEPAVSVHSGDIQVAGTISPSYGFVFISNTAPILNPWTTTAQDNMSWLPTTNGGSFNTYLPPLTAPWTTTYYVQAFAAGYAEANTTVTAGTNSLAIALTAAPGTIEAPLDMFTAAQASALAAAVGASSSAPYTFSNLVVNENFTFAHVNDYEFPEFEVVYASGVNDVVVNNTYLGTDSTPFGMSYITDGAPGGSTGTLVPAPAVFLDYPYYTSDINIYAGSHDQVTNQDMESLYMGHGSDGLGVTLWHDTDAYLNDSLALGSGWGIWVGDSVGTVIDNTTSVEGWGVSEFTNTGTLVDNLYSVDGGRGIETIGGVGSTYNWINATLDSEGFEVGVDFGPFYNGLGYPGSTGLTVENLNVTEASLGGNLTNSDPTTFTNVQVWDPSGESLGLQLDADVGVSVTGLVANGSEAISAWNVTDLTLNDPQILNVFLGVLGHFVTDAVINSATVYDAYGGLVFEYGSGFTASGLTESDCEFCAELDYYTTGTTTVNGVSVTDSSVGFNFDWSSGGTFSNIANNLENCFVIDCSGLDFYASTGSTATGVTATNDSLGMLLWDGATGDSATTVTSNTGSTGVTLNGANGNSVSGVTVNDALGVLIEDSSADSVTGVTVSNSGEGVDVESSTHVTVTTVSLGDPTEGVYSEFSDYLTVTGITATNGSLGVYAYENSWTTVSSVTLTNMSVGVYSEYSYYTFVSGVTATNTTLSNPFSGGNAYVADVAAITTYEDWYDSISNVAVTTYPAALYDYYSHVPGVSNVNATSSFFGIYLEDTYGGVFTGIGAYKDFIGMYLEYTEYNTITQSSFVDCTSYGVQAYDGTYDYIYDNSFIGNNGATGTYNAAHIQAYSGYGNDYYYFEDVGNYWSDWHTYTQYGNLAPYPLQDDNWDYYPLGGPEGTVGVFFYENGLASGTLWSMTFNGVMQSTSHDWLAFYVLPGTYAFTTGSVANYSVMPGSGMVTASSGFIDNYVTYTALYNVTVTETGLPANTPWSATVGGVTATGTSQALGVPLGSGTYAYQITPVAGYTVSPSSGMLTVVNGNYNLVVTFTQVTYAVTVTESGLSSGQSWSATVGADTQSSTGTAITFSLANGSYTVKVLNVSGYSVSNGGSVAVTVNGAPAGASVTFSPSTTTSLVSSDTFNMWLAVAIAIAVIALVIALLAVFMRRRREDQQQQPAQAWTPPPAGSTETAAGEAPAAAPSGSWSEGPPAGGSPPS